MPREFSRTQRLGEQLRRELSGLIRNEVKDPRLGMVTISDVEISRDLGNAKVYFTVLPDDRQQQSVTVLNRAAGFLRKELGKLLSVRSIPNLHFYIDESIERGVRISSLIEAAIASDHEKSTDTDAGEDENQESDS